MKSPKEYLEEKIAAVVNSWSDETLAKHTLAKGDAQTFAYINSTEYQGRRGVDPARWHDLQTDPGGFVYKSEIITRKAYFYQKHNHREIVFTHNTIMDAAIKKIKKAVTAVEPIFSIPSEEELDNPEEHTEAKEGWKEIRGREILAKAIEKSIKHGFVLYEPLKIPEKDLQWYTNATFFIRAWDEIQTLSEYKYGLATQYFIHPSNVNLKGYTIDITLNSNQGGKIPKENHEVEKLHSGLFFDPDNTDDHHGKPWFLGCWDNIIDYESIKEARNSYDEQIGNGFIVVGIPSNDYDKVKANVKAKVKNIRREQGIVIPISKDNPMAIEFKGSTFQVDFNADLNDIRRDIIANIGFPERWIFGDAEGAMESSGKDRMQVHDHIKQIFSDWKRFIKLVLKYHGYISDLNEVEIKAPYELQLTEIEKAEVDNMKAQTVGLIAPYLTLDEIRDELGKEKVDEEELFNPMGMGEDQDNPPNGPDNPDGETTETPPRETKTDADNLPPYALLDAIVDKTSYNQLKKWFGVSKDTVGKIKASMRDNKKTLVKTDSIMLDSISIGPDIYSSSGLIIPVQEMYYPEYKATFIRSAKQMERVFNENNAKTFPIGVYPSNLHDEGTKVGEAAQIGEVRLDAVDDKGVYGTTVYDLTKVDEILGPQNWIRDRLAKEKKISTSVGLTSVDIPIDEKTKYEMNHTIKSFIATESPRNTKAGVE
jgi:hypothetical protein